MLEVRGYLFLVGKFMMPSTQGVFVIIFLPKLSYFLTDILQFLPSIFITTSLS